MTAEMEIISNLGTSTNETVIEGTNVTLRIFLTDLPEPSAFDLYANSTLVEESAWNSGIGYEYNIPIKTTSTGTYSFYATIYFAGTGDSPVTTNTAVLKVITVSNTTTIPATSSSPSVTESALVSAVTTPKLPTLTLEQKIGIAIGVVTAIGVTSYFVIKPKSLQQFMNRH